MVPIASLKEMLSTSITLRSFYGLIMFIAAFVQMRYFLITKVSFVPPAAYLGSCRLKFLPFLLLTLSFMILS